MEDYYVKFAEAIARYAHKGQVDKGGNPYITHPEFVASRVSTNEEKIVAWLHDVLEDTDFNREELQRIFGDEIMKALDCVTHRKDESWDDYIERVSTNQIAIRVKMADLTHNMDLSRIPHPKTDDYVRIARYKKTYDLLQSRLVYRKNPSLLLGGRGRHPRGT